MNRVPPHPLAALFHHRWSVPVLAQLAKLRGARYVQLANGLAVSRDSLSTTLEHLIVLGLVQRNPGYGHPLRPEYVLTSAGGVLAPLCARFQDSIRRRRLEDIAARKWPMPVVLALDGGACRFNELRGALGGITARALSGTLRQLEDEGTPLVARHVVEGYPPSTVYDLTARGQRLVPMLEELSEAMPPAA